MFVHVAVMRVLRYRALFRGAARRETCFEERLVLMLNLSSATHELEEVIAVSDAGVAAERLIDGI